MKFFSLFSVIIIVSSGLSVFGQDKDPNAAEILQHYRESLSYLQSVSMKVDTKVTQNIKNPEKPNYFETSVIFRQDHGRTEWIGQVSVFDDHLNVDPNQSYIIKEIITGSRELYVIHSINELPKLAMISENYNEAQERFLGASKYGGPLGGRIFGNSRKSVAELLGEAENLYLRDEQEDINGISCYVLEGKTKHGRVSAWVSPDKGYNALKWEIHKTKGDLHREKSLTADSWLALFDNVNVQEVNDVFVTSGGCFTLTTKSEGNTDFERCEYKVSNIQLNPDFDALGAFKINLPNGTKVFVQESPGVCYIWRDGQVVDEKGRVIMDCK